jgi:hypothetical protein
MCLLALVSVEFLSWRANLATETLNPGEDLATSFPEEFDEQSPSSLSSIQNSGVSEPSRKLIDERPGTLVGSVSFEVPAGDSRALVSIGRIALGLSSQLSDIDYTEVTSVSPEFRIEGILPGEYLVTVHWRESTDLYFANRLVTVYPGQEVRLETIQFAGGEVLGIVANLRNESGTVLDPKNVLGYPDEYLPIPVLLKGPMSRDDQTEPRTILHTDIELGKLYRTHGLLKGRWAVELADIELRGPRNELFNRPVGIRTQRTNLPSSTPLEFSYTVQEGFQEVAIRFNPPSEPLETTLAWSIFDTDLMYETNRGIVRLGEDKATSAVTLNVSLLPGNYQLFARPIFIVKPQNRLYWFALTDFRVNKTNEVVDLQVIEGNDIAGDITNSLGEGLKRTQVVFEIVEIGGRTIIANSIYRTSSNGFGHFILRGVPTGAKLRNIGSGEVFLISPKSYLELRVK